MRALSALILLILLASPRPLVAADVSLSVTSGGKTLLYTRTGLLQRKDTTTIRITHDPAYPGRTMVYRAVPAASLFAPLSLADDAMIAFRCRDGFSAPINKKLLLNQTPSGARAYVAVEEPSHPWPPLKANGPSAGPFYLIWTNPKASGVGPEEWPFQLAGFEIKGSLATLYPYIEPSPSVPAADPIRRGFTVFVKNCFACHTFNKSGAANVGPDLNVPMNPTEYLTIDALKRQVRDPQSLRYFPNSRMNGFTKDALSDHDLDDLIAYLQHMAHHKRG